MTQAKQRKPSPARKAKTTRTNGHTNGAPIPPEPEAEVRPPERFEPTTTPTVPEETPEPTEQSEPIISTPEHPYGDLPVYVFHPKAVRTPEDSMAPIFLPHISTIDADVEFFWQIDELDPMHQSFAYMRRAKVPRAIQHRVVRLPDDEMGRLFRGWFSGIITPQGVGPPGES
jgi:hypothetical protein